MLYYCNSPLTAVELPKPGFLFAHPNPASKGIINGGIYERALIDWCQQFCKKDKLFIDIGAHAGTYSILLSPYCSQVHSFEAQRSTFYQLCGGIAINDLSSKIMAHHCALTSPNMNGKDVTLNIVSEDGGGSSILSDLPHTAKPVAKEKVGARSLDTFNLNNIGFLKLDVEGAELEVLQGAVKTLARSQYPPFIFEVWTDKWYQVKKEKLFNYVKSLGYKITPISGVSNMFLASH